MTPGMRESWEAIEYGILSREGIILLTGEAGTGKTSLIRKLLDWLRERRMPTAFIFNSHLESKHLYDFMLADFGVRPDPRWHGNALMCLAQWLPERCRQGQIPVLIVDEAQGLPLDALEEIRLLLNLETPHEKLLQIVLAGQPELEEKLNRPDMRQLKQRISLRCKTAPLTPKEARGYIQARLDVAGAAGRSIFSPDAVDAAHSYSRGIPRVMNLLCEHALINAYAASMIVVPARILDEVAREFHFDQDRYVPPIYSRLTDVSSLSDHAQISPVLPEPPIATIPAMPPPASVLTEPPPAIALLEARVPEPSVAPTLQMAEARAESAAQTAQAQTVQPQILQPHHDGPVFRTADCAANGTSSSTSTSPQTVRRAAIGPRVRKEPPNNRLLPTLLDNWSKALLPPPLRSELRKRSHSARRKLRHIWRDIADERRYQSIQAAVESRGESELRRLSTMWSKAQNSLAQQWREAAPAWQRRKASLLLWLEQPQLWRRRAVESRPSQPQPSPIARVTPAKIASWPRVNRAPARPRKPLLPPAALPSNAPGTNVNLVVMRWLRQPFRATASASSPRTATGRNR
ncbi:MAG TPA: AAA family ATPase [Candidatus Acidoferrales bacterium]